ncbi:SDR family oxidoreductase [Spongiibacter sp. KMU-166]|uniref:SDR family oxidoreductase n=1 Tax=Spongiibacter thalassae TaxID=2721624 RepID=A0ABX1GBK1_9GAMM|nr:SDR family oxidoreductase [Spongiibacter thalassae]NKI16543.1 SDR family oxidoreductase [Spongiibacter thalassae]
MHQTHSLVIGAASGMGRCIAERLSKAGRLTIADKNQATLKELAAEYMADAVYCDISDLESIKSLAAACIDIDNIVITAGVSPVMASVQQIIDVDFIGTAHCIDVFRELVRPGGAMVCISSIAGRKFTTNDPTVIQALEAPFSDQLITKLKDAGMDMTDRNVAYGIAKFGVIHLCRKAAKSWAEKQARINSISPGIIDTPMGNPELQQQTEVLRSLIDATPLQRMGSPDDIADCIEFLLSAKSAFITGTDILVDGGICSVA